MLPECRREFEVAALVRAGRWPQACEPELRTHVEGCAECREAVTIAELLLEADRGAEVQVPSAAQMWWRLAVRARLEREQAAARPVVWLQGIAAACGAGVVLTVLGQLGPVLSGAAVSVASRVTASMPAALPAADITARVPSLVVFAGALVLVGLASTAVYLWVADE
jgi:hypothetical protein